MTIKQIIKIIIFIMAILFAIGVILTAFVDLFVLDIFLLFLPTTIMFFLILISEHKGKTIF